MKKVLLSLMLLGMSPLVAVKKVGETALRAAELRAAARAAERRAVRDAEQRAARLARERAAKPKFEAYGEAEGAARPKFKATEEAEGRAWETFEARGPKPDPFAKRAAQWAKGHKAGIAGAAGIAVVAAGFVNDHDRYLVDMLTGKASLTKEEQQKLTELLIRYPELLDGGKLLMEAARTVRVDTTDAILAAEYTLFRNIQRSREFKGEIVPDTAKLASAEMALRECVEHWDKDSILAIGEEMKPEFEIIKLLFLGGANPNTIVKGHGTLLHRIAAIRYQNKADVDKGAAAVKWLIEVGSNVRIEDSGFKLEAWRLAEIKRAPDKIRDALKPYYLQKAYVQSKKG